MFYKSALEDHHCHLLVAEDEESRVIIGMGLGRIFEHEEHVPDKSGKIDDIWVEPDYRQKGLCKKVKIGEPRELYDWREELDGRYVAVGE